MASAFPTLTGVSPLTAEVTAFRETTALDPTIRSPVDAGYVKSSARFTRIPQKWDVRYEGVTTASKDLIQAHEEERGIGANTFTWTHPDGNSKTVRFFSPITYTPWQSTNYTRWIVSFILEEV